MRKGTKRVVAVLASVGMLAGALAGCSSAGTSSGGESGESAGSTGTLPPQMVEPAELAGAEFEVTEEQPLVIQAEDPVGWEGTSSDTKVTEFVAGKDDGSAVFNPAFEAVGPGKADVSVTSPTGETYEFTITVP